MKTIEEVMAAHGNGFAHLDLYEGTVTVRDLAQNLWFFYKWDGTEYRAQHTTRIHPKFEHINLPNDEEKQST